MDSSLSQTPPPIVKFLHLGHIFGISTRSGEFLLSNLLFTGSPPHFRMACAGEYSSKTSILTQICLSLQVLVVGLLTAISDHILKPFLAAMFNSLLQPLLLFLLKVLCGIRDLTDPLIDILAAVCSQLAVVLQAVRLVEINLQPDRRTDLGDIGSS